MKHRMNETAQFHIKGEFPNRILSFLKKGAVLFLVLLLFIEGIVLFVNMTGGQEAVANLPICIFRIESDSMYPRLTKSDGVLSGKIPFDQIKEGDLITCYQSGNLITHEVISVNDNGTVTTKGSMNSNDDGEITESFYVGKVLLKLPFLNLFLNMTDTPLQKIVAITIIFILCFGYDIGMKMIHRTDKLGEEDE